MYYNTCNVLSIFLIVESVKISSENYLDERNSTITDYNSKMQEVSSENYLVEVPRNKSDIECYSIKKYNNSLYTACITNGALCKVKLEQCDKNQNIKGMYILIDY